ncbi:MAG: hypothetical protein M1838_001634 [Thelocarpon superellum]|nr:MAG: hypothetical protein M1838_001634 [Thelocarpon superellum]
MSSAISIPSAAHFSTLIGQTLVVVTEFYTDWSGPCKQVAPIYEQLSSKLSRPNKIAFAKINADEQKDLVRIYGVTVMPTFMIFKNAQVISTVRGAEVKKLNEAVMKLTTEAQSNGSASSAGGDAGASGSGGPYWLGSALPKGYKDVTEEVDLRGVDLLNADTEFGNASTLFDQAKPSGAAGTEAAKGKGNSSDDESKADWVESDTDEQLMLFMPFRATLKVHSLHITSLPPTPSEDDDGDQTTMRPKTINVYSNRAHVLGFEEAEDIPATQVVTLTPGDWDAKTGTAKIELRFVKFQNVTSLVVFVVDGDGASEKVRIDRIRIIGETGEKRVLGKLEKIGDEQGE